MSEHFRHHIFFEIARGRNWLFDVDAQSRGIRHQHLKLVANTFWLRHVWPTAIQPTKIYPEIFWDSLFSLTVPDLLIEVLPQNFEN